MTGSGEAEKPIATRALQVAVAIGSLVSASPTVLAALAMELLVAPALTFWQWRISARACAQHARAEGEL